MRRGNPFVFLALSFAIMTQMFLLSFSSTSTKASAAVRPIVFPRQNYDLKDLQVIKAAASRSQLRTNLELRQVQVKPVEPPSSQSVPVKPHVATGTPKPTQTDTSGCNSSNWRSTMTAIEIWIDSRESSLNPAARNGQYWGLGQLGPSFTYTLDPCVQLKDQRTYIMDRYGSEAAALAWWQAHSWY